MTATTTTSKVCIILGDVPDYTLKEDSTSPSTTTTTTTTLLKVATASELAEARSKQQQELLLESLHWVVRASDLTLPEVFDPMGLANWVDILSPTGTVHMEIVDGSSSSTTVAVDLQPVHTAFLLAGLVSASERKTPNGNRILTAQRTTALATQAVPLKKTTTAAAGNTAFLEDADLIDEDVLLDDDLLAPPPAMGARTAGDDDCDGRKPCDNCTCGRADELAGGTKQGGEEKQHVPSSSCGKCHMGDAFRCASCPYLGKPAFKPGEEHLVLDLSDDL